MHEAALALFDPPVGIRLAPAVAMKAVEGSSAKSYTVRLNSDPDQETHLNLTSNYSHLHVSPLWLNFTPSAWSVPQTVTLYASADPTRGPDDTALRAAGVAHAVSLGAYAAPALALDVAVLVSSDKKLVWGDVTPTLSSLQVGSREDQLHCNTL